ncbi:alpha/beta hydrolase family protein [Candidatus Neomarinimicrobiota bacterium]
MKNSIVVVICFYLLLISNAFSQSNSDILVPFSKEEFSIIKYMLDYDVSIPHNVRIVDSYDFENHTREKIVFTSIHDERVPGYLAIPNNASKPLPLVIFCHGGGGSKDWGWQNNNYTGQIVQKFIAKGYAVLSLDAQHSGERLYNNDFELAYKYIVDKQWYNRERDMIFQTVIDYRRALDYLSTRSEIDINRVGVDGFSFGSVVALILSSVEKRIKIISLSGLPIGRNSYNWDYRILRKYNYIHGISQPLILQLGLDDSNLIKEDVEYFFDLIKSSEKKIQWYDSGHTLPIEYQDKVINWFNPLLMDN